MKEYGNKESWIKLIRLPYFYFGDDPESFLCIPEIKYISKDDNQVLLKFHSRSKLNYWVVYDSKNDSTKTIKIQDFSYVQSKVTLRILGLWM
jgi:hypothetical protein